MQSQVNNDDFYKTIPTRLREAIPEFISVWDDDSTVYPVIDEFRDFLLVTIESPDIRKKCFQFIDDALQAGKAETEGIIVGEIFEYVYPSEALCHLFRLGLPPYSLGIFEKFCTTS
jgi:hypothetical protein